MYAEGPFKTLDNRFMRMATIGVLFFLTAVYATGYVAALSANDIKTQLELETWAGVWLSYVIIVAFLLLLDSVSWYHAVYVKFGTQGVYVGRTRWWHPSKRTVPWKDVIIEETPSRIVLRFKDSPGGEIWPDKAGLLITKELLLGIQKYHRDLRP